MGRYTGLKISVTAEDIQDGHVGACESCPIAIAVRRAILSGPNPGGYDRYTLQVLVGDDFISIGGEKYPHTEHSKTFVKYFDSELETRPFEFVLGEDFYLEDMDDMDVM